MSEPVELPEGKERGQTKGSFFQLNFAQALTVSTVILGMLWTVFGYGRDISDNARAIAQVSRDMGKLAERVDSIDRDGTQFGRNRLNSRTGADDAEIKRIEKLEESVNKLVPSVERMATNLEWISGWVKVQSQQPTGKQK